MDQLKLFYDNKILYEAVKNYFTETLKEVAVKNLFEGKESLDVKGAKIVIDNAFTNLVSMYEQKQKSITKNKAR